MASQGYCSVAEVQAETQVGTYSTTTRPTLAEVEGFIDQIAGDLYGRLSKELGADAPGPVGYSVVIDTGTDKGKALSKFLALANSIGSAMLALQAAGAGEAPGASDRVKELAELYAMFVEAIGPAAVSYQGGPSAFVATHISAGQTVRFVPLVAPDEVLTFDRDSKW